MRVSARARRAYAQMAKLTTEVCARKCTSLRPTRCCEEMYCRLAESWAQEVGETITAQPNRDGLYLDNDGRCMVPPHLRPICSAHQCDIASVGVFKGDRKRTLRYFDLRAAAGCDEDVDASHQADLT